MDLCNEILRLKAELRARKNDVYNINVSELDADRSVQYLQEITADIQRLQTKIDELYEQFLKYVNDGHPELVCSAIELLH